MDIHLDASLLVIFLLIAITLGLGTLPAWHPDWSMALRWIVAVVAALLFLASVLVHELSHAVVGRRLGIPVQGITLFLFGGIAAMGEESRSPKNELLMTIVGPLTSLLIGVVGVLLGTALAPGTATTDDPTAFVRSLGPVATILIYLGPINIMLAIFNMIPGFPLDGGRVLRAALWWATGNRLRATYWASRIGQAVGWLFIGLGVFMALGGIVPFLGGGILGGVWLVLIGWFLNGAARASYQGLLRSDILEELPVRDLVRPGPDPIPSTMTLAEVIRGPAMRGDDSSFPVEEGGRWVGVISLERIREVPRGDRETVMARDVMIPAASIDPVRADEDADRALSAMAAQGLDQVPVVENGIVQGFVRQRDILRWLYLQQSAAA